MKFSCPIYLKKVENEKKDSIDITTKKAYIIWGVPEDEVTSGTSDDEESAKLCLMMQKMILARIVSEETLVRNA
ncbi:hypothetical protein Lal_00012264 [Lupinus albus]|nr:hypothetical protein Lal_00012264 [Lupinus albus]